MANNIKTALWSGSAGHLTLKFKATWDSVEKRRALKGNLILLRVLERI